MTGGALAGLKRRASIAALLLCALAVAAGCSVPLRALEYGKERDANLSGGVVVVFGRIVVVENGKEATPYSSRRPSFRLFHVEYEEHTSRITVDSDGRFAYAVPAGTYVVQEIDFGYALNPKLAVQAPYPADAYYLGSLVIDVAAESDRGGRARLVKVNDVRAEDRSAADVPIFQKDDPNALTGIWVGLPARVSAIKDPPARLTKKELAGPLAAAGYAPLSELK